MRQRALFLVGIALIVIGISTNNNELMVIGIVFMIIGLIKRKN